LVFGRRAGQFAAEEALTVDSSQIPEDTVDAEQQRLSKLLTNDKGEQVARVRDWLQTTMMAKAGPVKDETDLLEALSLIRTRREMGFHTTSKERQHNLEWLESIELDNLFEIAELAVMGALMRKESRTSFLRKDYPARDDEHWLRNITYEIRDGKVALDCRNPENSHGL
jgi:succinate dehydrogenase / fumarate reductase flavoprotein subunit